MSCDEVFVEYLLELLEPMGEVSSRSMFGGYGFFLDGLMFGLVYDSSFYLKADDENRNKFEALDLEPFVYEKTNKNVVLSYYQVPEEALDNTASLCQWSDEAYAAAIRAKRSKRATQNSKMISDGVDERAEDQNVQRNMSTQATTAVGDADIDGGYDGQEYDNDLNDDVDDLTSQPNN